MWTGLARHPEHINKGLSVWMEPLQRPTINIIHVAQPFARMFERPWQQWIQLFPALSPVRRGLRRVRLSLWGAWQGAGEGGEGPGPCATSACGSYRTSQESCTPRQRSTPVDYRNRQPVARLASGSGLAPHGAFARLSGQHLLAASLEKAVSASWVHHRQRLMTLHQVLCNERKNPHFRLLRIRLTSYFRT